MLPISKPPPCASNFVHQLTKAQPMAYDCLDLRSQIIECSECAALKCWARYQDRIDLKGIGSEEMFDSVTGQFVTLPEHLLALDDRLRELLCQVA